LKSSYRSSPDGEHGPGDSWQSWPRAALGGERRASADAMFSLENANRSGGFSSGSAERRFLRA
jgi:hypothetical protein